ncbi:MAG TPA: phosphatase PAP2 family protein [Gaiellaceae bacterium]|nr:phosphatase PAP2 family protein [Gaiellaceae bacterium]
MAREVALIALAVLVYFGVRGLTEGDVELAYDNARSLMRLERALGVAWEAELQGLVLGDGALVALVNWVYVYGHWPVIAASALLLYRHRRERYLLLRDAMFISGLVGFAFFAALPVAPPRLAQPGLVDTVTEYSSGYRALQPPALTNAYAALPSLHFGWNLLLGIVIFQATTSPWLRGFAVAMPVAMALAVVMSANHFVLDVVLGAAIVLGALVVAGRRRARTLDGGELRQRRSERASGSPLRGRAPVGELARRPAVRRRARRRDDRGRRPPVPGPPRGAPPEDDRAGAHPLGPLEARQPVRPPLPRRRPPGRVPAGGGARSRPEGP